MVLNLLTAHLMIMSRYQKRGCREITNIRGIRSIDCIVNLCERDTFYDFKGKKLTSDIIDDLNY